MDTSALMLILASRGKDDIKDLLPIILLTSGGQLGASGDLMNNPFLFHILMKDSKETDAKTLLLLMSTLASGNKIGGGAQANLISSPLFLSTLLGDDNKNLSSLLPLFLMSGGLGAGGTNMMKNNPLLLFILLNDKSDSGNVNDLLPLFLLSGMGGAGADISNMLPLILLSNDKSSSENDNILLLLMLSGGLVPSANFDLSRGTSGSLSVSTRSGETDLGLDNNLLKILLLGGGLSSGGIGDSSGGLQSILPLLLLKNKTMTDNSDLLLIILLQGLSGQGGLGEGQNNIKSLLPLFLLMGDNNSTLDTTTLLIISMMSQAQPETVTADPISGIHVGNESGRWSCNLFKLFSMLK